MFFINPQTGNTSLIENVASNNLPQIFIDLENPDQLALINQQNLEGNTALHYAIDNLDLLEELMFNGANPFIPNNHGDTVYDFLQSYAQTYPSYQEFLDYLDNSESSEEYPPIVRYGELEENEFDTMSETEAAINEYNRLNEDPKKDPKKPPENSLFDQIKLYVWDFDCTITQIHSCSHPGFEQIPVSQSVADERLFDQVIIDLQKYGKYVAIASYGKKEVILQTMEKLFGHHNPFNQENIITPADVSTSLSTSLPNSLPNSLSTPKGRKWLECHHPPPKLNKVTMIKILQDRYQQMGKNFNNDNIVLIDDTSDNVHSARNDGYYGILIPKDGCQGFNRNLHPDLTEIIKKNKDFATLWNQYLQDSTS